MSRKVQCAVRAWFSRGEPFFALRSVPAAGIASVHALGMLGCARGAQAGLGSFGLATSFSNPAGLSPLSGRRGVLLPAYFQRESHRAVGLVAGLKPVTDPKEGFLVCRAAGPSGRARK